MMIARVNDSKMVVFTIMSIMMIRSWLCANLLNICIRTFINIMIKRIGT